MFAPIKIVIVASCSLSSMDIEPGRLNTRPYEPCTVNKVLTTQDMYNIDDLVNQLFMQEREDEANEY
jgi:hypothetical protein